MSPRSSITSILSRWHSAYSSLITHAIVKVRLISSLLDVIALIASFVVIGCLAAQIGYTHSKDEIILIHRIIRGVQIVFIVNILFNLLVNYRDNKHNSLILKWAVDICLLVTLFPLIYPHPSNPWIPFLERILYSYLFLDILLVIYAVIEISRWVMKCMGRRTNPAIMLAGCFFIFIIIGTVMLMLPRCTYYPISFIDALFVSTSAVCITGLTSVDIATILTPLGQTVLAVLIEVGALGVLTFTSFFTLFYTQGGSIYAQLMLRDLVYARSFSDLLPTLLYILGFTLIIEAGGAVLIWLSIHGSLPVSSSEEVAIAAFHSISAFANAGFSTIPLGMSNPMLLYGHQSFYLIISLIVVAGAIGFPILINAKDMLAHFLRRLFCSKCQRRLHLWSMNSRLLLTTTIVLYAVTALLFLSVEYSQTLQSFSFSEKVTQSIFNAVVPRSAGFSTISPAAFAPLTLLVVMIMMWIGGAAQSTAGGIKVNTFATMLLGVKAAILGRSSVTVYNRSISHESMQRVWAVIGISLLCVFLYTSILFALEPDLEPKALFFETVSAVFTVGSSMGVTPELSTASKLVLCTAMLFGRVGLFSLLTGVASAAKRDPLKYPSDNIIIS